MNKLDPVRVMIVEDDPLVFEMIQGSLQSVGIVVTGHATTGLDALEMIDQPQANMPPPDAVLMDIRLPDLDGIQMTRLILERRPIPIVILTAHETPELIRAASDAGASGYLVKPSNPREMERAIAIAQARFGDLMELRRLNAELEQRNRDLSKALANVEKLSQLIPICARCKKVRDDRGYWQQVEQFVQEHSDLIFSHSICPDCLQVSWPADILTQPLTSSLKQE